MIPQTEQNWYPQKTSKNDAPGVPRWSQNGSELIEKILKISKLGPKKVFWGVDFLMIFWVAKKLIFLVIPIYGSQNPGLLGSTGG